MTELTWKQEALYRLMSEISESCYCAGWLTGNEYTLWEMVADPNAERRYGMDEVSERDIQTMREISTEIGGWVRWHDDEDEPGLPSSEWGIRFIAMPDWLRLYDKRMADWAHLRASLTPAST
ncbi:MAG TPA: hypothetical protein VIN03_11895 [Roseateles sp.]